jgi:nucleoid DNA-binding protein
MNKPQSLSVKDFLIRTLTIKLAMNNKVIEAVINHQFQTANDALDSNISVEISGFGKFVFNEKKADKKTLKLLSKIEAAEKSMTDENATEAYRKRASVIYTKTKDQLKLLKPTNSDND